MAVLTIRVLKDGRQTAISDSDSARANVLAVGTAASNTELTKAILDSLVSLQDGSEVGGTLHTHDDIYYTETEIGSTGATSGADLVGTNNTPSNYSPSSATVQDHLEAIDNALSSAGGSTFADDIFRVQDNSDATKEIAFEASAITTATTRTITMPDADVDLGLVSTAIQSSEKGAANGVAELDANSKVPSSQLPAIAITDVFSVADITARDALTIGTGDGEVQEGDVVIVTDASADAAITSGSASYIYDGAAYQLLKAGDEVLSVNGETGTVTLDSDDISEGSTNLYHTDERAQDAVGTILTDSSKIDFTYDDVAGTITATIVAGSIVDADIDAAAAIQTSKLADSTELSEAVTFFAATDISGAEAETLTDGSSADALHNHSELFVTLTNNTGSSVAAGDVVLLSKTTSGELILADASAESTGVGFLGIADETIADGSSGRVQYKGIRAVAQDASFSALGDEVYLSETAASTTQTAPTTVGSTVYVVGYAYSSTEIILDQEYRGTN